MSDKMREALELARKRIEYLGFMLTDERHQASNERYFFPTIDAALAQSRPVTAGALDAPRLPAGWLNDQLDKAAERAASMPAWMVNPNAPPAAPRPSVIDFLKQWTSRESRPVIDVARDMVEAWDKGEHEGCGADSERAYKKWAAQPASPAAGREEIARHALQQTRACLEWLDRKGGLGLDVHAHIQTVLSDTASAVSPQDGGVKS